MFFFEHSHYTLLRSGRNLLDEEVSWYISRDRMGDYNILFNGSVKKRENAILKSKY